MAFCFKAKRRYLVMEVITLMQRELRFCRNCGGRTKEGEVYCTDCNRIVRKHDMKVKELLASIKESERAIARVLYI
jgi:hypothetical protein